MAQPQTQLAALRWVQLVSVRGSSIHAGQNWAEPRTDTPPPSPLLPPGRGGVSTLLGDTCQRCTFPSGL